MSAPRAAEETPGGAGRGRTVFQEKQCARCHLGPGHKGVGPALSELRRPQGALELSGRVWNHAPTMFRILREQGIEWPVIDAAEMGDLMVYLQADRSRDPPADVTRGQALVIRKGCLKCHRFRGEGGTVAIELTKYLRGYESPVAWAVAVWNHSPRMAEHAARVGLLYPRFAGEEMSDLFEFLKRAAEGSPK